MNKIKINDYVKFKNENTVYKVLNYCNYGEVDIILLNVDKPIRKIENIECENTLYTSSKALVKVDNYLKRKRYEQLCLF